MLIVFLTLAVSVLVVSAVFVAMFLDVAFEEPAPAVAPSRAASSWRPPLLTGRSLMDWMTDTADTLTASRLRRKRHPATAVELAALVETGASIAIEQSWQKSNPKARLGCPAYAHARIGVTPPEAIRIAEYIRTYLPQESGQIHDRARENLVQAPGTAAEAKLSPSNRCPLMAGDNACLAYAVRPLRCRGASLPSGEASTCGGCCGTCSGNAESVDAYELESRAQLVTQGVEEGFSRALKSKGLDGNLYELNSALVTALENPNAAERWIHHDSVFANCQPCA